MNMWRELIHGISFLALLLGILTEGMNIKNHANNESHRKKYKL
jgi:hypothetical protein